MVRKKKKHQEAPQAFLDNDTSDEEHEKKNEKHCSHVPKSVNIGAVKKTLKNQIFNNKCQQCSDKPAAENKDIQEPVKDVTVWLCLQCGYQGCKGDRTLNHALLHYKTPRSDSHAVMVNTTTWSVWCCDCEDEILLNISRHKHLSESVDFIKRQVEQAERRLQISEKKSSLPSATQQITETSLNHLDVDKDSKVQRVVEIQDENKCSLKEEKKCSKELKKTTVKETKKIMTKTPVESVKYKVKGLANLGNTCFFNAVMQNLSQTTCLLELLEENCKKGHVWHVEKPPQMTRKDHGDINIEGNTLELKSFDANLQDGGALTQGLMSFLKQMNSQSSAKSEVINPAQLFGQICKKMPQFRGFQQQDSHEVLRYLLDGIRNEEIRRQQTAILKAFNLTVKVNPKCVDEETKNIIKAYSRQASHTLIDSVFGGQLLSTIKCEECHKTSQVLEPFMDLSLPVAEEKPGRPGTQKHAAQEDLKVSNGDKEESNKPTIYQERKMKRQAKKEAKKQAKASKAHRNSCDSSFSTDASLLGQDSMTEVSSLDIAEADVEDNVDSESVSSKNACSEAPNGDMEECQSTGVLEVCNGEDFEEKQCVKNGCCLSHPCDKIDEKTENAMNDHPENIKVNGKSDLEPAVNPPCFHSSRDSDTDCRLRQEGGEGEKCLQRPLQTKEWVTRSLTTLVPHPSVLPHSCSVVSCLNQFTSPELLTGSNKFGCENCAKLRKRHAGKPDCELVYTSARKQLLIFSPPAVLTLHLKRFQQVGMNLRKVNRFVEFPLLLDLAPYCSSLCVDLPHVSNNQTQILYSLYGVVEHTGRLTSGHYTAYVKVSPKKTNTCFLNQWPTGHCRVNQLLEELSSLMQVHKISDDESFSEKSQHSSGQWFYVSDSHVREVSEEHVLKCQAYLLFYQRIL